MSSVILVDRLLSNKNLQDVNDYAVVMLSELDNKANQTGLDAGSQTIRELFTELYQACKPFIHAYEKRSRRAATHDVDYDGSDPSKYITEATIKAVEQVLKKLDTAFNSGLLDPEKMETEAVELEKLTLLYSIVALLLAISKFILDNTLPLDTDITFYDRILSSKLQSSIATVQMMPSNIGHLVSELYHKLAAQDDLAVPDWIPNWLSSLYRRWVRWIKPLPQIVMSNVQQFMHSPATYLIDKRHTSTSMAKQFLSSSIALPYFYTVSRIRQHRRNLLTIQCINVQKLGYIIEEMVPSFKLEVTDGKKRLDCDYTIFAKLSVICHDFPDTTFATDFVGPDPSNVTEATSMLSKFACHEMPQYCSSMSKEIRNNKKPSFFTRYWLPILAGLYYLPAAVQYGTENKQEIQKWYQENVVDVVVAFYENWVYTPLNNVWKTIRHDDDSRIAVMSKQSLNSDLDSLERMVVDYCVDNYSYLQDKNLTDSQRAAMINQIKEQVKSGDMEMVMKIYEDNMKSPVISMLSGSMIRNLLIQIQKTKVDGDVALSGIDKILQSQQLVFGIVAASPAALIVWWLANTTNNYFRNGYLVRFTKDHKRLLLKSMNELERIVGKQASNPEETIAKSYYDNGRIYIALTNLRQEGVMLLPSYLRNDWVRDLNDITGASNSPGFRLATIQRIWNQYGEYFHL